VARSQAHWDELTHQAMVRSLAGSLALSNTAASIRVDTAVALAGPLSATGDALESGAISEANARLIARRTRDLGLDAALGVQYDVLDQAGALPPGRMDQLLRRAVAQRTALDQQAAHRRARRKRRITPLRPLAGGMASIEAIGPAEDMAVLHEAIKALGDAKRAQQDAAKTDAQRAAEAQAVRDAAHGRVDAPDLPDTIAALRFDALIDLACQALDRDDLPTRHGRRPSIQVVVPAATLLGIDEAPGEIDGYGPIDADTARALAFDPTATWHRLLTDPMDRVLEYGRTTYRPPQPLKDLVLARDRTCTGPGCRQPARECQIDHEIPYPRGATGASNNDAKCGLDHALKTAGLMSVLTDHATGDTRWTDRHGTTYVRPPETIPQAEVRDDDLLDLARALSDPVVRTETLAIRRALRTGRRTIARLRRDAPNLRGGRARREAYAAYAAMGLAYATAGLVAEPAEPDDDPPPF
jgi:hypothetical protein